MSSRITCDVCGHAHGPIQHKDWQRLVSFYVELHTGTVPLRLPPDGPSMSVFREACQWAESAPDAPAWARDIAHEYGAPVVEDLKRAAVQADAGDFVICQGIERIWDGRKWTFLR